jgi:fumarylpyruvate hydrolase
MSAQPAFVIDPPARASLPVRGSDQRFPVRRIYCVGRNYAAHAKEMGKDPEREPPFFFQKPADALVENGVVVPYPPQTKNLHHEIEWVVAIGRGGRNIPAADANAHVLGYSVGIDLTRRDLQNAAKDLGRPWEWGKSFDHSAPCSALVMTEEIGHPQSGRIWLSVNGVIRQQGDIADLIWSVPEVIAEISASMGLEAGDLIYTGTPAGVGAVTVGDVIEGGVEGVADIKIVIGPPQ